MNDKTLTVQSDRTMLLDVHSECADDCRADIIAFADLIKSPEHVHTYQITQLSLWNAISSGLTSNEILSRLKRWSRFDIDPRVEFFITDSAERYGDFVLTELDEDYLLLSVRRPVFALQLKAEQSISKYLEAEDEKSFRVLRMNRGVLKASMIKLGFPVDDRIPLKSGEKLKIKLRNTFTPRPYQKEAVKALLGDGGPGTGYGTIVLPCGSGKTVVGILAMAALGTRTLILCPNVTAVHQWIRELLDKTELTENEIGEYSGEKKDMKPVTVCTYQIITWRPDIDSPFPRFSLFREGGWGFIIYDEVHMLPAPVFRITAELQAIHRLGLTATLVREDGREDEVFSLVGPKRYDTPWSELEAQGYIAKAWCHEIRLPLPEELEIKYAIAKKREKYRIAAENPLKIGAARKILERHAGDAVLIIGQYLDQLEVFKKEFGYPIITGATPTKKREELYALFKEGKIKVLIVSKVANSAIDLPDASVAIQISGTFGSRQEEAQRLGRILRPKDKDSHFYTLVTEYTEEEDFAQNRQKFLSEQGYSYSIEKADAYE
ncbi:MAG: DEAD/DEAH box helicase [Spirochaetes bacterium]|uniref:DNA 3'-5' helicase n=1 Tax=Candidatus Ornithospirochaeta stercoripullorum TaxID=2840899 RepID=A0A9D9E050_9SPIO|nr:DEAD/DEAH box helicase [Candidatus Ornithospirochaeta stercoripullorum]